MLTKELIKYVQDNKDPAGKFDVEKLWELLKIHEDAVRKDEQSKFAKIIEKMGKEVQITLSKLRGNQR